MPDLLTTVTSKQSLPIRKLITQLPVLDDHLFPVESEQAIMLAKNWAFNQVRAGLFCHLCSKRSCSPLLFSNLNFFDAKYLDAGCYNDLGLLLNSTMWSVHDNYYGTSIMDNTAEFYDPILNSQLSQWLSTNKAQAVYPEGLSMLGTSTDPMFAFWLCHMSQAEVIPPLSWLPKCLCDYICEQLCEESVMLTLATLFKDKIHPEHSFHSIRFSKCQDAPSSCYLFVLYKGTQTNSVIPVNPHTNQIVFKHPICNHDKWHSMPSKTAYLQQVLCQAWHGN